MGVYEDFFIPEDEDEDYFSDVSQEDLYGEDEDEEDDYNVNIQGEFLPISSSRGASGGKMTPKRGKKKKKKNSSNNFIMRFDPANYSNEYLIKHRLLQYYDKTTRPVRNDSTTTTLQVGMSLFHILDTVSEFWI